MLEKKNEQILEMTEKLEFFEESLETKATVSKISKRLDGFAAIEHIDALKHVFLPRIEDFTQKIDKFMNDNQDMRECVRRFDEDLSIKANKIDIVTMVE